MGLLLAPNPRILPQPSEAEQRLWGNGRREGTQAIRQGAAIPAGLRANVGPLSLNAGKDLSSGAR